MLGFHTTKGSKIVMTEEMDGFSIREGGIKMICELN